MYPFENARQRDGDAEPTRPDRVDELLNGERLGYENGEPLATDSYQDYPDEPAQLSAPKWQEWTESLLSHDLVNSYDDAVSEATTADERGGRRKWSEAIQNAANAAQLDVGELFDGEDTTDQNTTEDALAALTESWPADVVRADNPLVVGHLYAEKGLSVTELASGLVFDCPEDRIRSVLRTCGLIEPAENGQIDPTKAKDIRLGGSQMQTIEERERAENGGLSVDASDF